VKLNLYNYSLQAEVMNLSPVGLSQETTSNLLTYWHCYCLLASICISVHKTFVYEDFTCFTLLSVWKPESKYGWVKQ